MLAPALHRTYGRAPCHAQGDLTCEVSSQEPPSLSRILHPDPDPDPDEGLADEDTPLPQQAPVLWCSHAFMAVRTTKNEGPKQPSRQQEKGHPRCGTLLQLHPHQLIHSPQLMSTQSGSAGMWLGDLLGAGAGAQP